MWKQARDDAEGLHLLCLSLPDRLGRSSVRYAVALFSAEAVARTSSLEAATATSDGKHADFSYTLRMRSTAAAAYGEMTHVFVDPKTRRPTDMAPRMRAELEKLVVS